MCGRYTLSDTGDLLTELQAEGGIDAAELAPRYNIAPTQNAAVVRAQPEGEGRELAMLRWGLVPFWAKELSIGNRMINARSETAAEKASFKHAIKKRRCAVLADGFYEWRKLEGGKQPYHIHLETKQPFVMAGLWERWSRGPDGPVETFTILTTDANDTVRPLHDRMPVILPPDTWDLWLDPTVQDPEAVQPLMVPAPDDVIAFHPVSREVNSPRNDVASCIEPLQL